MHMRSERVGIGGWKTVAFKIHNANDIFQLKKTCSYFQAIHNISSIQHLKNFQNVSNLKIRRILIMKFNPF